jgi:hypothetical protein
MTHQEQMNSYSKSIDNIISIQTQLNTLKSNYTASEKLAIQVFNSQTDILIASVRANMLRMKQFNKISESGDMEIYDINAYNESNNALHEIMTNLTKLLLGDLNLPLVSAKDFIKKIFAK